MSEEEIIKNANEMIYNAECWIDDEEYTGVEEREWAEFEKKTIQGLLDLYNKEKERNKKLENILITIRNKTKSHIIWQDEKTQSYNLKGTTKQEIYKVFSEIKSLVKGEYIFLDNKEAIDKLLEE